MLDELRNQVGAWGCAAIAVGTCFATSLVLYIVVYLAVASAIRDTLR